MAGKPKTTEPVFKAPVLTSAAQRRAEELAERRDAWRIARGLLAEGPEWSSEVEPFDVLQLANFLVNGKNES